MPIYTHKTCTFLEMTFKLIKENEITGVCSKITVVLFNDRIKKINAHWKGIVKQSQKLYNVTC